MRRNSRLQWLDAALMLCEFIHDAKQKTIDADSGNRAHEQNLAIEQFAFETCECFLRSG
jgi:hypothetical protein